MAHNIVAYQSDSQGERSTASDRLLSDHLFLKDKLFGTTHITTSQMSPLERGDSGIYPEVQFEERHCAIEELRVIINPLQGVTAQTP